MNSLEEVGKAEVEWEPSVDSNVMEERIMARRIRIGKRLEASKRDHQTEDAKMKSANEPDKELSKSRKQIEQSMQRIFKLKADGSELVSNVEVACDAREAARRIEENDSRILRTEKLEAEVKAAAEKFEEITRKWDMALSKEIPQELLAMLLEQRAGCDSVIDGKNKLILELQADLKGKDDKFVKDLRKQAEDVDLVLERMEEQIRCLQRAYREELDSCENAFFSEREELLAAQKSKWKSLTDQRLDKEVQYMKARQKRVDDFEAQLQTLRVQDAEEYNMVKIKLETDVQILEQNLQQMKATFQLNQEKLEYNFQVLKKRDEENTMTKSQQKRKITRLQDLMNNLKVKLKKQEKQFGDENQSLTDDLTRITEQYKELQKKFRHFQITDDKKFNDIWKMNEGQIKELVSEILAEDQIVFEQQLGLHWEAPNLDFLHNVGPINASLGKSTRSAMEVAQEVFSEEAPVPKQVSITSEASATTTKFPDVIGLSESTASGDGDEMARSEVKAMLELLCDESGFLVEEKLVRLLASVDKDEQSLMKLDAIFNAIGVASEKDIHLIGKYLRHQHEQKATTEEEEITACGEPNEAPACNFASELIHPNDVIKALRKFVEDHRDPSKESRHQSVKLGISPTSCRDSSCDEAYWKQLASVMDKSKERLWDAVIDGFEKYNHVLTERATLIEDTEALRQQNAELRMLLRQYLNSKVNQELEIPPTRILQLELTRD